mgnify:CR=1 FL=1
MDNNQIIQPNNVGILPPSVKLERKKKVKEYRENEEILKQEKIQEGTYQAPKSAKVLNFDNLV